MKTEAPTAEKAAPGIPARDAYKVDEFCQKLSISRATAYRLAKADKLKIVKIGGRAIVPASEIARLIAGDAMNAAAA